MSYTNAIFYINLVSGSDTARTALTSCTASNPSGSITRINKTGHGLVTGAVVTLSAFSAWLNGDWKITWVDNNNFDLVGAVWQTTADASGTVTPFGGSSWTDAWRTITSGATAARIAPGDEIRISKTTDPISVGTATWTNCQSGGGFPSTKNVTATGNNGSGLIRITVAAHGYDTDDIIQLVSVGGTLEANGAWKIVYVSATQFDLVDSVYTNAWTSGGTAQKINSKAVVLTTANLTKEINRCKSNWSNGVDGVSTLITADHKEGGACIKVTMDAATNTNSKQAYQAISISGATANNYQAISFWFKNEVAIADATTWKIGLCSDNAGATIIDTFPIPAIASTGRWVCLTIPRSGGGNLGGTASTAIASIAIWSGATAPTASKYVQLDNIIGCTTGGLSMVSLISKNGSAQGGTEGYYGIQSINGKIILLDNDTNNLSNAGRGYSTTGNSPETVATYIRDSFRTPVLGSSTGTGIHTINDSGTFDNSITWQFGYNTSTGNQDGETFFDGGNGFGFGIYLAGKSYNSLNYCNVFRVYIGVYFQTASNFNTIINLMNSSNNQFCGLGFSTSNNINISLIGNCNNNVNSGISISTSNNLIFTSVLNINNNLTHGLSFSNSMSTLVYSVVNSNNNSNYGLSFSGSSNNILKTINTINNSVSGVSNDIGINFIRNATLNENNPVSGMVLGSAAELRSIKEDGQVGNNWTYFYGATSNWQIIEKQGSDPGSWKVILTDAVRRSNYPVPIKLEGIQCAANKLVTIVANVKKGHATNVVNQFKVYADTVRGIAADVTVQGTATTSWETITLTFTPTNACIAEVFYEVYSSNGSLSNVYLGSISITQAP